ncbi:MAG: hypothetical protein AMK72_04360 [Planctomycetes bacterium SM23_25]|nr:MAG: hypothetical protein AMK72_04360 [Planctomycetes bacterium SM23_25]
MATILGFFFMLLGAICGGSFGLPSKFARKDTPWENLWGPFFLFVTIIIPTTLGPVIVNDFFAVYGRAVHPQAAEASPAAAPAAAATTAAATGPAAPSPPRWSALIVPLVFGLLWGLGSMTLGMSFAFIGLSLAYALNYGAQIATGSMVPMLMYDAGKVLTPYGYVIMAGVGVCLLGVVVSGRAGILKERSLKKGPSEAPQAGTAIKKPKMLVGVIIGIVSGVLCACYAVAAKSADVFGVNGAAKELGNYPWQGAWAVMALIVWGGAVSSCIYCAVLLTKNRTWGHFLKPGAGLALLLAFVMAVLHDGAIFCFGLGVYHLGDLGVSVGYAVFMSFAIIVGNVHGFLTGEWKGAGRRSVAWIIAGIAILIVGVCILGVGNAMAKG